MNKKNYKTQSGPTIVDRFIKYEAITRNYLIEKQSVIVRIDAKSFKTFLKQKSLENISDISDLIFKSFINATLKLCKNIHSIEFAYHFDDEVSFFLKDYHSKLDSQYFNGNIQNIVSTLASEFTYYFNDQVKNQLKETENYLPCIFKCKTFNTPENEVLNYFIYRQRESFSNNIVNDVIFFKQELELPIKNLPEKAFNYYLDSFLKSEEPREIPEEVKRTRWCIELNPIEFSVDQNKYYKIINFLK